MPDALTLSSERFMASGGMEASGVRRLLGKPRLPQHQILLREAGQNSLDAARAGQPEVGFRVSLRHLNAAQASALSERVFASCPAGPDSGRKLAAFLAADAHRVLEISDFGTRGLGGPTRADVPVPEGDHPDFVNFVRNIGAPRDQEQGGGTYGYGKSSLYVASGCSTIVVDSLAETATGEQRRLIACHLGESYVEDGARRTGRHWWGVQSDVVSDFVEPASGEEAHAIAAALGLPPRPQGQTGTTVMILDPALPAETDAESMGAFAEALLWNFWPRMLSDGRAPRLNCALYLEDEELPLPAPEEVPPLDLFVEAYRTLKAGGDGSREIHSGRPIRLLGKLCIRRGIRNPRRLLVSAERSLATGASAHIAVMRPVELVVRYYDGSPLPGDAMEWAGVFICDDSDEVEEAFAAAEPPAHDDWDAEQLTKGSAKTYVRVAVREICRAARDYALPASPRPGAGEVQPSLARAADRLGALLGDLNPASVRRPGGGGRGGRRDVAVGSPTFSTLQDGAGGPEAVFTVHIVNRTGETVNVRAVPGLILDGVLSETRTGPAGETVDVLSWTHETGALLSETSILGVPPGFEDDVRLTVSMPALSAVGVAVRLAGDDS